MNRYPKSNHRAQARDGLVSFEISVASKMITLKRFCAVVKALIINFFQKNFIYPMPDATFLKISGAKLEFDLLRLGVVLSPLMARDILFKFQNSEFLI